MGHGEEGRWCTAVPGHCQVDVEQTGSAPDEAMIHFSASDAGHLSPDTEGLCSQEPMMDGPQEVTADTKEILDDTVHRAWLMGTSSPGGKVSLISKPHVVHIYLTPYKMSRRGLTLATPSNESRRLNGPN